jgi:RNA polymerase sigma-70 factor (ECF subfamily)
MLLNHDLSDAELICRLKAGDESVMTVIYKTYWEPLFVTAFNLFKDKEACEDIIQEIFIKLWDRRAKIEISVSLKAYLYASMRYEVYRQIRSGKVSETLFDGLQHRLQASSPQHDLEHKELVAQVTDIVEKLPAKCKEVYKLSREEQLSHKEISEKLNISTKTVENHLTKALHVLRISLRQAFTMAIIFLLFKG